MTFIHPWVAYTDNCGGDGHAYTDTRTRHFQDLNVTHCSFRPHIHLRQYKHVMLSSTSFFFFFQMSRSSKLKSKRGCAHTHTQKKKFVCHFCRFCTIAHSDHKGDKVHKVLPHDLWVHYEK